MGQSVIFHIVPPVLAPYLSFSLLLFCPPTSPCCPRLHGLFLFSSLRSKRVGEALSVPSRCQHHGGPAGKVPRSLLHALVKVSTSYFWFMKHFFFVVVFIGLGPRAGLSQPLFCAQAPDFVVLAKDSKDKAYLDSKGTLWESLMHLSALESNWVWQNVCVWRAGMRTHWNGLPSDYGFWLSCICIYCLLGFPSTFQAFCNTYFWESITEMHHV